MNVKFNNVGITDIACSYPKNIISLAELTSFFEARDIKRITASTGINSIRQATIDLNTIDLCQAACLALLEKSNINPMEIDGLICVSQTHHKRMPAMSSILQHALNLSINTVTFDINQGCSGYINGLYLANTLIKAGGCKKVLLSAGDTLTKYLDLFDKSVRFVFGDGACATLIQNTSGEMHFILKSDGSGAEFLSLDQGEQSYLAMDGNKVMEFALREVPSMIHEILDLVNWQKQDVGSYIFHQPNLFMLNYLRKKIGIDSSAFPIAVDGIGNTSSASIPITLCTQRATLHNNNRLIKTILCGFGVGLSWSACTLDLSQTFLHSPIEI